MADKEGKAKHREYLNKKYDYKNKKVLKAGQEVPEGEDPEGFIRGFDSMIEEQLNSGDYKLSNSEVLRAHVKNWRHLNLKQRRVVLNFMHARRSRESKREFIKELSLLGQKIAHDNVEDNKRMQAGV